MWIKNSVIVDFLRRNEQCVESCIQFIESRSEHRFSDEERKVAENQVKKIQKFLLKEWKNPKIGRNWKSFVTRHKEWLDNSCEYIASVVVSNFVPKNGGRRTLTFDDSSQRSKRQKVAVVLEKCENSSKLLMTAAIRCSKAEKDVSQAKILSRLVQEEDSSRILKKINSEYRMMTVSEALQFMLDANLSVDQYNKTRNAVHGLGCKIFPYYKQVAAEKEKCYPAGISVTSTCAKVPWESLIEHTLQRIIEAKSEDIEDKISNLGNAVNLKFIVTVGMDGTGSQSLYNQTINENQHESSLFVTAMTPLQLQTEDDKLILWTNPSPQSTRFCRTQQLIFQKETVEANKLEYKSIIKALDEVEDIRITLRSGNNF